MSISTASSTTNSSRASPATSTQLVSIPSSPDFEPNQLTDDDGIKEEPKSSGAAAAAAAISVKIEQADIDKLQQQVKRRKEDDEKDLGTTTEAIKFQAGSDESSSNQSKLTPSLVRLNPIDQAQGSLKQAFIVTGHIVEHRPSASSREVNKSTKGSSNSSARRTSNTTTGGSINVSSSNVVGKNNSQSNLWKLSSNHVVKLESASNILSKTTGNSSPLATAGASKQKAPLSRPDLVASSKSALHAGNHQNQARTKPLLMNHNQHLHSNLHGNPAGNQLLGASSTQVAAAAAAVADNNNMNTIKFDAASKAIATTSQLFLSSFISPNFKPQQLANGASLSGLQFCLTTAPQTTSNLDSSARGGDLIAASQAIIDAGRPNSSSTSSSLSSSFSSLCTGKLSTSPSHTGNSKSKSSKSAGSEGALTLDGAASSSSATGNAAAARLLDLGKRLLEATREGNICLVRELVIDSGAPFTSDWLDTTALHIAAQNGFSEIAEVLIQGGINKDAQTKLKRTALHLAAQSGSGEVADLLIRSGSDVNSRDMLKMTPLHWAVERGHLSIVERLLVANADYKIKNKFQLTPLDIAKKSRNYNVIELFKNWTSDTKIEDHSNSYRHPETSLNESQDFLDIDYHLALVDSEASVSRDDPMLDAREQNLDLVELEWNKFDFVPDLFLPAASEDEHNVSYLMKIVEELQKENQQLRQKVEQLSTTDQ